MVKVIIKKFMFLYGKVIIDKWDRNYFKLFKKNEHLFGYNYKRRNFMKHKYVEDNFM